MIQKSIPKALWEEIGHAQLGRRLIRRDGRTREHEAEICGVPTRFVLTAYANRISVIVTQTQNMGTLVRATHRHALRTTRIAHRPLRLTVT